MCNYLLLCITIIISLVNAQKQEGYKLDPLTSYVILAPNRIRANELVQISVSIFELLYEQLTIRLAIKVNSTEIISSREVFKSTGTRIMQLKVPNYARTGTYWLHVEGSIVSNASILFSNLTKLTFSEQSESIFIHVSKPIYHQSQIVRFRVIPMLPDLTPAYGSLVSIDVLDASGNLFKRWLNPMTNIGGIIELDFPLSDQVHEGVWLIRANHERFSAEKTFQVKEYWRPLWDVNVTLPLRITDNQLGLYGLISANYTSGKAVKGNATVLIQLRKSGADRWNSPPRAEFRRYLLALDGIGDFLLPMSEIRQAVSSSTTDSSLANTEIWVNVTYFNWWEKTHRTGWAFTKVYSSNPLIKFLGGMVRPFKPNMYFTVYLVVYMADGSMVKYSGNRKVTLSFYCLDNTFEKQITLPISDDGVIRYTYRPSGEGCITYRLEARYIDETDRILSNDQQRLFAVNSYSGAYLQLSTSTFSPKVNEYMVVHVQTNYPTDKIHYVVVSNGNILATDQLRMPNAVTSRTFSIAVSRYMFPISHIVAYFIKDNSEIVSDSLTFYANYTHLNNVQMQVNRGKDLNQDTLEIRGYAKPGSYIAFSVMHADLYAIGGASFLREYDIVDELMTYEQHSQAPLVHTWYEDFKDIKRIYLPTSSNGADTNSTMNSSGLIIFTDANFTKANFYHTCNETENPARALPCYSLTGRDCYSRSERCDGINQCATWIDEMDCPENETKNPQPLRLINTFDILNRQWNDGAWLWHSTFVKADGQIQFRVNLPKMNADWVAGAFSVDSELGLALMQQPYLFSGTRRFYMTVELPEEAVWGEQIGVRACLFNNWNYWIEALVEVKPSPDLRIVHVGLEGRVSAYAPEVSINKAVQSLAYLEAGTSRYIYMPVLPKLPGNTSFTICAYSFIASNCETHTIYVRMNGVTNYYHTASFLDLTSSSTLFVNNFKIIVPQKFTIPERRLHRFVPGSQKAILSVVGDFIGPALSEKFHYADTQNILRLPFAAAENIFFELGYNMNLLLYLHGAGHLPYSVLENGLIYCSVVLQKGFSYFNPKIGAFSNFRDRLDETDPLVTAIALWSLLLTRQTQWNRLIYVDDNTFVSIINYLKQTQQFNSYDNNINNQTIVDIRLSGSWNISNVIDRRFSPIINKTKWPDLIDQECHRRIPSTAMVIIALRSTERTLPSGVGADKAERIVSEAVKFLSRHILNIDDLFSQMIGTYALKVAVDATSQHKISHALKRIEAFRQKGDYVYYANYRIPPPKWELDQAGRRIENPRLEMPNDGYGVLCSSIYFLLKHELGEWSFRSSEALDMVHWLASERNHVAGFASTFDSLFAMHALRKFALADTNRALYRMAIDEKISSMSTWTNRIYIDTHNYSTVTHTTFPSDNVWGDITMKLEGTGRVLLQLDAEVNVEYKEMQKMPKNPLDTEQVLRSFEIECTPGFLSRNNSIMIMTACGRWVGTTGIEPLPQSGMAVFEIGLPTGFIVLNDDLRRYVNSLMVPNLRYARANSRYVHFFFDTITPDKTCVQFTAERYYPVANITQQHRCSAYEYYEPGRYNNSLYNVVSLYTNNICNVCGSFACPYCPDYNLSKKRIKLSISMICLIFLIRWILFYIFNIYN
ncbi:unnamed protein product [Schistosoma spindalis]|nr:unnamed protein product [Schistosoma spindale]